MSTNRTEKEQVRVHIRWMIRRDMPEVMRTERASFEYAWTEDDFLRCLRQRNCIGMVAELGERGIRPLRLDIDPEADLTIPSGPETLAPFPAAVRAQQLALELAVAHGINPDQPAGLSKVTPTH